MNIYMLCGDLDIVIVNMWKLKFNAHNFYHDNSVASFGCMINMTERIPIECFLLNTKNPT